MEDKYSKAANNLAAAADIAIKIFETCPPKGWDQRNVDEVISNYVMFKNLTLNPETRFRNMQSLKYDAQNIFTMFQEGSGNHVEAFWKEIKNAGLPFKRENKLVKILKRGKIKNALEYDFIIDVLVPYQQEGLLTQEEVVLLNQMIGEFENKNN